jgi:hypothetical protein
VTFSIFRAPAFPTSCMQAPKQSRHPERSASQIYRVTKGFVARSRRISAVLIYPCCSELFDHRTRQQDLGMRLSFFAQPPAFELFFPGDGFANIVVAFKVEQALAATGRSETFPRALVMLDDTEIQVAGIAQCKACLYGCRGCRSRRRTSKMLASSLVLDSGEKPCRGPAVEKLRAAWVSEAPPRFLRLRSGQALRLRAQSLLPRDQSVKRSAQDDDSVWGLASSWLEMQEHERRRKKSQLSG